jgi:hypothetical protein
MFSYLFSITLPNIKKYFLGIYFPEIYFLKENYFPANKQGLIEQISRMVICRRVPSRRASIFAVLFVIEGPGIYQVLTTGKVIKP